MEVVNTKENDSDPKLYELGFLLDPAVPEDAVSGEMAKLSQMLEAKGGRIEVVGTPILRTLAYTVEIAKAGKRYKYNQAHFSWLKFHLVPGEIEALNIEIGKFPGILRHLLVHGTMASSTPALRRYVKKDGVPGAEVLDAPKATEAEIDKEVDALIASADPVVAAK
jgi:ribosomal protein S6